MENNKYPLVLNVEYNQVCYNIITDIYILNGEKEKKYRAFWDTGSNKSIISPKVVSDLSLEPLLEKDVYLKTSNKLSSHKSYEVDIQCKRIFTITTHVLCTDMIEPDKYDVLIGMDIISMGDFCISNYKGKTFFSFRFPSINKVDLADTDWDESALRGLLSNNN